MNLKAIPTFSVMSLCVALTACLTLLKPPAGNYDVISNDLTVTPSFETKTLKGRQEIVLRNSVGSGEPITFSPNAMVVESATIDGSPMGFASNADAAVFTPPAALKSNQIVRLVITYSGSPKRGVAFLPNSIVTNYWACDWMFCNQDRPSDRASTKINLQLPAKIKSLSVGRQTQLTQSGLDIENHNWREQRSVPAYLLGFAVGSFEVVTQHHKGIELSYINATGKPQDMNALFGTTPAMIDFFSSKAGLSLPTSHYSQLLVEGRDAQEQSTYSIIGLETIKPILTDPQDDWVIAHELAHQWWGNLLTYREPDEFWLNEGITVFMTAAWKEHRFGRAAYDRELGLARTRHKRAIDSGQDRPLAYRGDYASFSMRRAVQYSKGAVFMDHLRTTLGEAVFWRGLRDYTRQNAGKSVVSTDLQNAMERASKRDLSAIFSEWVYGASSQPMTTP